MLAKESYDEEIKFIDQFIQDIETLLETREDSKFINLKKVLDDANKQDAKRVLVFTQYTDTLDYLKEKIRKNPDYQELGAYSGDGGELLVHDAEHDAFTWKPCTKEEIKTWFFQPGIFKIMLCTDAASEGLNFHICSWLVNYDLPWNPMRVEQRIGRIDRVKQEADILKIFNLMYTDTIEGRIYKRLWDRIRIFHNAIGPLQPILNVYQKAEHFAISEGDDMLDESQIENMLGDIKDEMQRAKERQDFFQRLLVQRVLPDISASKEEKPVLTAKQGFQWLCSCLDSELARSIVSRTSIDHTYTGTYTSLLVKSKDVSPLFDLQGARISFKSIRQNARRDINTRTTECNLTVDDSDFEKLANSYFFTPYDGIFENLVKYTIRIGKKAIPVMLKGPVTQKDSIESIEALCWIDLSGYPLENRGLLAIVSVDIKNYSITNQRIVQNLDELKDALAGVANVASNDSSPSTLNALNI
nr:helicase-related protein [Candidatus Sigynarchaeota archaeon]